MYISLHSLYIAKTCGIIIPSYQRVGMFFGVMLTHSSNYIELVQLSIQNSKIYKLGVFASQEYV